MPLLSPRETNGARALAIALQRCDRIAGAGDMCRIRAPPDHYEVIPRDLPTIDAVAVRDEFLLSLRVMHQKQVGSVARLSEAPARFPEPGRLRLSLSPW